MPKLAAPPDQNPAAWARHQWPKSPIRVKTPPRSELIKLRLLIIAAALSLMALLVWLSLPGRIGDPGAYIPLTLALLLRSFGWMFEWFNYWQISVPPVRRPRRKWTVDVLTTACPGEPQEMIVRTLRAMVEIKYPHTNYLCDEGDDPALKEICQDLGVVHVTRTIKKHAKAGNINNALGRATGEIAVVLDPDHEPAPYLLHRTLGYFEDPSVGFVQSVQPYRNQGDSFVARGAAEQTYHFYGPIMMGMNGRGTTQAIGANCVFRRAALNSIGGHASGLAEDMHTSMRLYSKGWRSVYVPESLTRGLVPSTLGAFYKQQIKWSCGAFDLLFQEYPKLFRGFTVAQALHYASCPIYFLRGVIGLLELVVPILCLTLGWIAWRATLPELLAASLPVLAIGTLVRMRAQRWLLEPEERGLHFAGGFLAAATWWVYLVGFLCAVFRVKVPYIPTPKEDKPVDAWKITLPNFIAVALTVGAIGYGISRDSSPYNVMMAALGLINVGVLIYVSVIAQQETLSRLNRRFAHLWPLLSPFKPVMATGQYLYDAALFQLRERWIGPSLAVVIITVLCLVGLARNGQVSVEAPHELNKEKEVGGFYTGITVAESDLRDSSGRFEEVQRRLGFSFRMVSFSQAWGPQSLQAFPEAFLRKIWRQGGVPLITWEPWTGSFDVGDTALKANRGILRGIARGTFDSYLKAYAGRLQKLGEPVLIRFAPLPDEQRYPWSAAGGDKPADFIAAWRHIVDLFNNEGASNVGWVWNPSRSESVAAYYPGDGYVDWVAMSGVGHQAHRNNEVHSVSTVYEGFRPQLARMNLPVMLVDVCADDTEGEHAGCIADTFTTISARYHEIKSVVLSDETFVRTASEPASALATARALSHFDLGRAKARPSNEPLWADRLTTAAGPRLVSGEAGHFELKVNGEPFYIRGIAYNPAHDWRDGHLPLTRRQLETDLQTIHDMGGNTIRRYGKGWYDRNIFNVAAEKQLKVLYGFWFDQDVDYVTDSAKRAQFERDIEDKVSEYRDSPGLLGWSLGNEVWGLLKHKFAQPYLTEVRHAHVLFVEQIARRVKELDPAHPVLSVHEHSNQIAGAFADYAKGAPTLDVIGVNSYYEPDISSLHEVAARFDPSRPYLVSEFGPDGYWHDQRTPHTAPGGIVEATALEKARLYERRWQDFIESNKGRNVGGIAYCWRDRYEGTSSWFGMIDWDGRPKPAFFAMRNAWSNTGAASNSRMIHDGPRILSVAGGEQPVTARDAFIVRAAVGAPAGQTLDYRWSVVGPNFAADAASISPFEGGRAVEVKLPNVPGWYRVHLEVTGETGLDEVSIPVLVQPTKVAVPADGSPAMAAGKKDQSIFAAFPR